MVLNSNNTIKAITDCLSINSPFINEFGILNGKAWMSFYMYNYYIFAKDKYYEDLAFDLLKRSLSESFLSDDLDFHRGICGVGWLVEHLVEKKMLDANTSELLEVFDSKTLSYLSGYKCLDMEKATSIGIYLYSRYKERLRGDFDLLTHLKIEEGLIKIIDEIYRLINTDSKENIIITTLEQALLLMNDIGSINIYPYKVNLSTNIIKNKLHEANNIKSNVTPIRLNNIYNKSNIENKNKSTIVEVFSKLLQSKNNTNNINVFSCALSEIIKNEKRGYNDIIPKVQSTNVEWGIYGMAGIGLILMWINSKTMINSNFKYFLQ